MDLKKSSLHTVQFVKKRKKISGNSVCLYANVTIGY